MKSYLRKRAFVKLLRLTDSKKFNGDRVAMRSQICMDIELLAMAIGDIKLMKFAEKELKATSKLLKPGCCLGLPQYTGAK